MSELTRDGTDKPFSRGQILRLEQGQGNIIFPVQLTSSRIGKPYPEDAQSVTSTINNNTVHSVGVKLD